MFVHTLFNKSAKLKGMRVLHFFKAKSRFGISNPHKLQEDVDIGVENGPDAVLTRDFLTKFSQCYINEYVFPEPEKVHPKQFNKILGERLNDFRRFINSHIKCGQTQVVIGGDHSVTLPSILAVKDRVGSLKNLGYIQFDSHGDMNLKASSPTGNFHGMYMRPLVARFDIRDVERSVSEKLPVGNIMYVGNLDLDKGEAELFAKKKIKNIDRGALLGGKRNVIKNFRILSRLLNICMCRLI